MQFCYVWEPCILNASVACGICCDRKSYILIGSVAFLSKRWQHFCCQVHSDWLSGLGEVGWPFLVLYKYVTELLQEIYLKNQYHSSVNFGADPKSGFEIKKFLVDMVYTHMHYILDKLCSAKAVTRIKINWSLT